MLGFILSLLSNSYFNCLPSNNLSRNIASATGLRINIVRKVLYDTFGKALITGVRVKDEKKGWFVYRWRAKRDQIDNFIENQKKKILDRLRKRLQYEESTEFYHCSSQDCPRVTFEQSVEIFFKCPNCKGLLNRVDLKKLLAILKRLGMNKLLVEGGGEINWSMLTSGLVDEIIVTVAPKIVGGRDAVTFVEGEGFAKINNCIKLRLAKIRKIDNEVVLSYKIINE